MGAFLVKQCTGEGAANLLQRPTRSDVFKGKCAQVISNHSVLLLIFFISGFYLSHFLVATPYDQIVTKISNFQQLDALGDPQRLKCPCVPPRLTIAHALPALPNMTDSSLFYDYCMEYASGFGNFGVSLCDRYSSVFMTHFAGTSFISEARIETPQEVLAEQARVSVVTACQASVLFLAERDRHLASWRAFQERAGAIQPSPIGAAVFQMTEDLARNISEHMASGCVEGSLHDTLIRELTPSREALYDVCQCTYCSYIQYQETLKIVLESVNKAFVFAILLGFVARILLRITRWCCIGKPLQGDRITQKLWHVWVEETSGEHGEFNLGGGISKSVNMTRKSVLLWNNIVFVTLLFTLAGLLYLEFSGPRAWVVEDVSDITIERFNQEPTGDDENPIQCECQFPAPMTTHLKDSTFSNTSFTYQSCLEHTRAVTADLSDYLVNLDIAELESAFQLPIFSTCAIYHASVQARLTPFGLGYTMATLPRETQYNNLSHDYIEVVGNYDELLVEYEANEFWSFLGVQASGFDDYDINQEFPKILKVFKFQGMLKLLLITSLLPEVAREVIPLVKEHKGAYSDVFFMCRPHLCSFTKRESAFSVLFRVVGEVVVGFSLTRQILVFVVFLFCHKREEEDLGQRKWHDKLKAMYLSIWTGSGNLNYLGCQSYPASEGRRNVVINTSLLLVGVGLVILASFLVPPEFEEVKVDQPSLAHISDIAHKTAASCPCNDQNFEIDAICPEWQTSSNHSLTELCLFVAEGNEALQCAGGVSWLMLAAQQVNVNLPTFLVKPEMMVQIVQTSQAKFALMSGCSSAMLFSVMAEQWWNLLFLLRTQYDLPTIPHDEQGAIEGAKVYSDLRNLMNKLIDDIDNNTHAVVTKGFPVSTESMLTHCNPSQCSYTQARQQGLIVVETLPSLSAIFVALGVIGGLLRRSKRLQEDDNTYVALQGV